MKIIIPHYLEAIFCSIFKYILWALSCSIFKYVLWVLGIHVELDNT